MENLELEVSPEQYILIKKLCLRAYECGHSDGQGDALCHARACIFDLDKLAEAIIKGTYPPCQHTLH